MLAAAVGLLGSAAAAVLEAVVPVPVPHEAELPVLAQVPPEAVLLHLPRCAPGGGRIRGNAAPSGPPVVLSRNGKEFTANGATNVRAGTDTGHHRKAVPVPQRDGIGCRFVGDVRADGIHHRSLGQVRWWKASARCARPAPPRTGATARSGSSLSPAVTSLAAALVAALVAEPASRSASKQQPCLHEQEPPAVPGALFTVYVISQVRRAYSFQRGGLLLIDR